MSDVTLQIGGRPYKVACAPGEEEHVAQLGRLIDEKVRATPGQSEARGLLFAALMLADELSELRAQAASTGTNFAQTLESLAERMENLAAHLEDDGSST
ncbi:cell division protein ZapA [Altericroceibacterium xinjiangense]|uniref:cell division protein ZapA n=1 Tax=Altericroceibacterium xinjiangense TaxID=762261 RepID=UPI000F7EABFC|nr:cell division protein ZapA [Altericroceibacterium xinjiangense]